jgi:hypothetical protein
MDTETKSALASESAHCNNGGCTRQIYRGRKCFRCWAGIKWTSIWQRIQNKNGHNPHYAKVSLDVGKVELINWILENPPPLGMDRPSIDRIDNSKGYSLDNIRWLEHRINSKWIQRDTPEGFKKCVGCGETKPLTTLYWSPNGNKWQGRCRLCKLTYDRAWRANYARN